MISKSGKGLDNSESNYAKIKIGCDMQIQITLIL